MPRSYGGSYFSILFKSNDPSQNTVPYYRMADSYLTVLIISYFFLFVNTKITDRGMRQRQADAAAIVFGCNNICTDAVRSFRSLGGCQIPHEKTENRISPLQGGQNSVFIQRACQKI